MLMMTFRHSLKKISKPKHTRLTFDLEKLKDPNVLETFQAKEGGKCEPLAINSNEVADIDSMITTVNTAMTDTTSEILGKHRQKKKPWVIAKIADLCDKRGEPKQNRFEPEGSEKYKEVCKRKLDRRTVYHVFIEFKKAFDRVWYAALWATVKKYTTSAPT